LAKELVNHEEKASPATEKPQPPKETTAEFIASISSVLVIGLFIITFVLQAFEIPSSSMENTLLIGDHVFVDRIRLAPMTKAVRWLIPYREPHRGDIVVFVSPSTPGLFVVKRVVGQPGDHIHLQHGRVWLNGVEQNEPQVIHSRGDYSPYRDEFPNVPPSEDENVTPEWMLTMRAHTEGQDIVVPPDSYFGMGDNRDVSLDSRYWGFIPKENILGRPMFIYWSFVTPASQWQKTDIGSRVSFLFHIVTHFFTETRWSRMFKLVR